MNSNSYYKGYHMACISSATDNGGFRARVAVMALDGQRTRSQRFLDMEVFPDRPQADARALAGGMEWIDAQLIREQLETPTNFLGL